MQGIHKKERKNRKRKTLLTHTGLLMEGVGRANLALDSPRPRDTEYAAIFPPLQSGAYRKPCNLTRREFERKIP
jgi:hypothetical protein